MTGGCRTRVLFYCNRNTAGLASFGDDLGAVVLILPSEDPRRRITSYKLCVGTARTGAAHCGCSATEHRDYGHTSRLGCSRDTLKRRRMDVKESTRTFYQFLQSQMAYASVGRPFERINGSSPDFGPFNGK
ncbi:hypothetical protein OSTOST_24757, partial [Ostertagia ostertagi]